MLKLINFAARKAAADTEAAFLDLIDKDIKERPESVAPLSKDLLGRAEAIEALAEANREAERIEC